MSKLSLATNSKGPIYRDRLAALLNDDLAREISGHYCLYRLLASAQGSAIHEYIADQLGIACETGVGSRSDNCNTGRLSRRAATVIPKPVRTSDNAEELLRFDLENEGETIRNYRERVRQC